MAQLSRPNRETRRLAKALEQSFQVYQVASETRLSVQQTSGPLPAPEVLREYNNVHPGLAERIVVMAESESIHRRGLEDKIVTAQSADIKAGRTEAQIGQICALIVSVFSIGCGTYATRFGHPIAGSCLSGGTLIALVGAFIYGRAGKPSQATKEGSVNHQATATFKSDVPPKPA